MTIRLGANPIGWSNDDLQEIGGDTPLETCLAEAKEAGFEGVEKGNKMPNDGAALKAKFAEFGLVFVGGWYSTELLLRSAREEFEAAQAHIAMTKGARAGILIAAETSNAIHGNCAAPLSKRPRLAKADWAGFGAKMTEFASRVADVGLTLCYHHHMGTIVQSEADIDAFMENTKAPVNLLLDTGHATWGGSDPAALGRRYRDRIRHVHCKDVRKAKMDEANAERLELPRLHSRQGRGAGRVYRAGRRHDRLCRSIPGIEGLFRLGHIGGRAGSEKSALAPLCQEGRRAFARGVP
jgi:inosose dehydratase